MQYVVIRLLLIVQLIKYELYGSEVAVASSSKTQKHDFDNDFEEGSIAPWIDQLERGTTWVPNEIASDLLTDGSIQPPPPPNGNHFIWLKYDFRILMLVDDCMFIH